MGAEHKHTSERPHTTVREVCSKGRTDLAKGAALRASTMLPGPNDEARPLCGQAVCVPDAQAAPQPRG